MSHRALRVSPIVKTLLHSRRAAMSTVQASPGPLETILRQKINNALNPRELKVYNDSYKHSHHKAMVGNTSSETHFRLEVVSAAFEDEKRVARHRMIYDLLSDEMSAEGGIHALQLDLNTPNEVDATTATSAESREDQKSQKAESSDA